MIVGEATRHGFRLLRRSQSDNKGASSKKHFELLVVKLHLFLGDQAALGALPHRINKTHALQRHFLTAAFITETPAAPPAVVLSFDEVELGVALHTSGALFVRDPLRLVQRERTAKGAVFRNHAKAAGTTDEFLPVRN